MYHRCNKKSELLLMSRNKIKKETSKRKKTSRYFAVLTRKDNEVDEDVGGVDGI